MAWDDAPPDPDLKASDWTSAPPDPDLASQSPSVSKQSQWKPPNWPEIGNKAANIGLGAMETIDAPFQVAGEAIRGAGESEPLRMATAENPHGFRAPSIVQRLAPSLRTPEPPADPFQKAYQGLEGIANLPRGIQAASDVVTGQPDIAAQIGGAGIALGLMPPKIGIAEERTPIAKNVSRETSPIGEMPPEPPLATGASPPGAKMPPSPGGAGPIPHEQPPPSGFTTSPKTPLEQVQEALKQRYETQIKPKMDDLSGYINRNFNAAMQKPGAVSDLADLAQEKSQMMAVKAAGGGPLFATQGIRAGKTPNQINNELRAIGQYMLDNKIVQPELGNKLMLDTHESLLNKAGAKLGAIRQVADDLHSPNDYTNTMLQHVDAQLGSDYSKGMPGSKEYQTALKIVEQADPTYQGMAEAATKLNKLANKANRNFQTHTPFTDVANQISQLNNQNINSVVGPDVALQHERALAEFGVNKKIQNMLGRKVGQELHRTGPGSMTRALYQKFMDEVGYKGGAKVLNKMAGNIKANPDIAGNLPALFKSFINEVEDILPSGEGQGTTMAHGGIVGEMDAYLTPKYGAQQ